MLLVILETRVHRIRLSKMISERTHSFACFVLCCSPGPICPSCRITWNCIVAQPEVKDNTRIRYGYGEHAWCSPRGRRKKARSGGGREGEIPDPFRRLLRKLWVMVAWLPRLFKGSFRFGPKICRPAADTKVSCHIHVYTTSSHPSFFKGQRGERKSKIMQICG